MKNEIVKFRVTHQEKEDLNFIISALGEKNISDFFRNIINDLSSVMIYRNNISELDLLEKKYTNYLKENSDIDMMKKFSIKKKLNLINEFKEEIKNTSY